MTPNSRNRPKVCPACGAKIPIEFEIRPKFTPVRLDQFDPPIVLHIPTVSDTGPGQIVLLPMRCPRCGWPRK